MTGKSVTYPCLTAGNESTESMTDCEAAQRTMETLHKVTLEFCEAEMRKKLKDSQGLRSQAYQHVGDTLKEIKCGMNQCMKTPS